MLYWYRCSLHNHQHRFSLRCQLRVQESKLLLMAALGSKSPLLRRIVLLRYRATQVYWYLPLTKSPLLQCLQSTCRGLLYDITSCGAGDSAVWFAISGSNLLLALHIRSGKYILHHQHVCLLMVRICFQPLVSAADSHHLSILELYQSLWSPGFDHVNIGYVY